VAQLPLCLREYGEKLSLRKRKSGMHGWPAVHSKDKNIYEQYSLYHWCGVVGRGRFESARYFLVSLFDTRLPFHLQNVYNLLSHPLQGWHGVQVDAVVSARNRRRCQQKPTTVYSGGHASSAQRTPLALRGIADLRQLACRKGNLVNRTRHAARAVLTEVYLLTLYTQEERKC
jgi:hypothetical protein